MRTESGNAGKAEIKKERMKRIRLRVAYDGTAYCGFQIQPKLPTIEGALNDAVFALTGEKTEIIGASRTDAGVHSDGNVAVFDTGSTIPPEKFFLALNPYLPDDITVTSSDEVPSDWHPRKRSCEKTYIYRIQNSRTEDPTKRLYAMHFPRRLNVETMQKAAEHLLGTHDFTSFANPSSQVLKEGGSPVRTIKSITVEAFPAWRACRETSAVSGKARTEASADLSDSSCTTGCVGAVGEAETGVSGSQFITITVTGDGFLYNMVRIIAGTLMDVGTGRFEPEDIDRMLFAKDRTKAGMTAEARGLTLHSIRYFE